MLDECRRFIDRESHLSSAKTTTITRNAWSSSWARHEIEVTAVARRRALEELGARIRLLVLLLVAAGVGVQLLRGAEE